MRGASTEIECGAKFVRGALTKSHVLDQKLGVDTSSGVLATRLATIILRDLDRVADAVHFDILIRDIPDVGVLHARVCLDATAVLAAAARQTVQC